MITARRPGRRSRARSPGRARASRSRRAAGTRRPRVAASSAIGSAAQSTRRSVTGQGTASATSRPAECSGPCLAAGLEPGSPGRRSAAPRARRLTRRTPRRARRARTPRPAGCPAAAQPSPVRVPCTPSARAPLHAALRPCASTTASWRCAPCGAAAAMVFSAASAEAPPWRARPGAGVPTAGR